MTNLQILLDFLDPEESVRSEAILAYFDKQENSDFTISGVEYAILDIYDLKEVIKDQISEEYEEFKRANRQFIHILEAIDEEEVIKTLAYDLSASDITAYDYLGESHGMYIFCI